MLDNNLSIDQFNYSSGVLSLTIVSNQSLDGQTIQFNATTVAQSAQILQLSLVLPILIDVVPSPDYSIGVVYRNLELALEILYWLVFLVSIIFAKIVGAEMMGVLQISFLGMICLPSRSDAIVNGSYLRYSNGWNPLFNDLGTVSPSMRLNSMGFRSVFLSDYNLMLLVLLVSPFLAFCLYCAQRARLAKQPPSS